jgi:AraC-like DNA-binding protein
MRAWELAPAMVGDDDFGLHFGAGLRRGAFGLLEYAARASATLGDALERLVRDQRLLHDRARFALQRSGARAILSFAIAGMPAGGPRHFSEAMVSGLLAIGRDATGMDFVPLEVKLQHPAPASVAEHRRILRCKLQFGATETQLVMRRAILDQPLRDADPALAAVLDVCAAHALERLPPLSDGIRLCRELVASHVLAGVTPRLDYIARELALSPRSLQRVLAAARTTFSDLVEDVRRELAVRWLTDTSEQAAEIAYRLGYAHPSAFHHAFRRWTGTTVSQFRRRGSPR